jgi:hypothetical protein
MRLMSSVFIFLALLSSGGANAQTAAERLACQGDYGKFCHGVTPGGGRVLICLSKYESKLSPACRKVVAAHSQ